MSVLYLSTLAVCSATAGPRRLQGRHHAGALNEIHCNGQNQTRTLNILSLHAPPQGPAGCEAATMLARVLDWFYPGLHRSGQRPELMRFLGSSASGAGR